MITLDFLLFLVFFWDFLFFYNHIILGCQVQLARYVSILIPLKISSQQLGIFCFPHPFVFWKFLYYCIMQEKKKKEDISVLSLFNFKFERTLIFFPSVCMIKIFHIPNWGIYYMLCWYTYIEYSGFFAWSLYTCTSIRV